MQKRKKKKTSRFLSSVEHAQKGSSARGNLGPKQTRGDEQPSPPSLSFVIKRPSLLNLLLFLDCCVAMHLDATNGLTPERDEQTKSLSISLSTASQSIRNTSSDCDGAPSLTPLPRRCALSLRPPLLGTLPKVYTTTTTARVLGETSLRHLTTISLSAHPPTTSPSQNITPPPPPPPRCTWFFEVFSILPQSSQVQPWEMSNARHLLQPPP
ncbi:hypothetical protein HDK90DRAFT_208128 [Phyllosticta capitalensis]|uniref:Uncharacterized protein n=1 Tax=Phyllosticta capitalensis TaxID=121624 RepID=A0ABR1YSV8_9PEZI